LIGAFHRGAISKPQCDISKGCPNPIAWHIVWFLEPWLQKILFHVFLLSGFYNSYLLRTKSFEKFEGRFLGGILRHKFPSDGEVEDGLAELLDVFAFRGEAREVVEVEAGMIAESISVLAIVQAIQR